MIKIGSSAENILAFSVSRDVCYGAVALSSGWLKIYRILNDEG